MTMLNESQIALALKKMNQLLSSPARSATGMSMTQEDVILDRKRGEVIATRLLPTLKKFLSNAMPISEFKPEIDRINKQNELWGFKGIKGQMFFNLVYNACLDEKELTAELCAAIEVPDTDELAKSRLRSFTSYVRRLGDALVESGGSKHARPNLSSIPFFLSYFWQIQAPERWPVFYTNSVQVLSDLNLYQTTEDLAENYIEYSNLHIELKAVFSKASGRAFTLYDVEHVWWCAGKVSQGAGVSNVTPVAATPQFGAIAVSGLDAVVKQLPDSFVPPIVGLIPRLAANEDSLESVAKASGTSVARALEKSINAAFTILGYESKLLGQGAGRVQDGLAISVDDSYAIIWDAKARQGGYKMGTDDRTIREYITTQSRDLKRKKHFRNLYYFIISSSFQDDFDDLIRGLKMDTDINELCLIEADAIVAMVEAKLRDPSLISLGPDGLQRLFCKSGILTSDIVKEELG